MSAGWNFLGIIAACLGFYMVVASDFGRSDDPVRASWFVGGLVMLGVGVLVLFTLLNFWHLWAQREVILTPRRLEVRRWLAVLTGGPAHVVELGTLQRVSFLVRRGGAKVQLATSNAPLLFSIWFWSLADARQLAHAWRRLGLRLTGPCRPTLTLSQLAPSHTTCTDGRQTGLGSAICGRRRTQARGRRNGGASVCGTSAVRRTHIGLDSGAGFWGRSLPATQSGNPVPQVRHVASLRFSRGAAAPESIKFADT